MHIDEPYLSLFARTSATLIRRQSAVAIIGAGMSGLCMAITLRRVGIHDITIYEQAHEVGGTWRDNTYPGLTCDIPAHFYQYSFAPNNDWTHLFAPGPEIQDYLRRTTDRFDIRRHIRFGTEITEARFEHDRWQLHTSSGAIAHCDFLIAATGILRVPKIPDLPGLDTFEGPMLHTARWDASIDLTGKRVGVIGTGSIGVQVICGLTDTAGHLTLFQRSANWILPLPNPRIPRTVVHAQRRWPRLNRLAYRASDATLGFFSRAVIQPGWRRSLLGSALTASLRTVGDAHLRRKLTPSYQPLCRRMIVSDRFYRTVSRDHVHVETVGIDSITPTGIRTADGTQHTLDALVLATGFDAHAYLRPLRLIGPKGRTLETAWRTGPKAHLTVALPGFPNFFMLLGPHSPVGNYSLVPIAESQAQHILAWIDRWRDNLFDTVAPTHRATAAYNAELRAALPRTVWTSGCSSWYLDQNGNPELWPWTPADHRNRLTATPNPRDYDLRRTHDRLPLSYPLTWGAG
ncbi:flavin-containing monooxygenase [Nocardia crassostreae]|uniref:flavin-containing monooxygenase n=1 Tax=Nocardia crassostreae TaxID=53428 RepID=UPI0009FD859A|nr:NAD(P)/FAD-dependent oxidoreductase [Nocardia crassostreae]